MVNAHRERKEEMLSRLTIDETSLIGAGAYGNHRAFARFARFALTVR